MKGCLSPRSIKSKNCLGRSSSGKPKVSNKRDFKSLYLEAESKESYRGSTQQYYCSRWQQLRKTSQTRCSEGIQATRHLHSPSKLVRETWEQPWPHRLKNLKNHGLHHQWDTCRRNHVEVLSLPRHDVLMGEPGFILPELGIHVLCLKSEKFEDNWRHINQRICRTTAVTISGRHVGANKEKENPAGTQEEWNWGHQT